MAKRPEFIRMDWAMDPFERQDSLDDMGGGEARTMPAVYIIVGHRCAGPPRV